MKRFTETYEVPFLHSAVTSLSPTETLTKWKKLNKVRNFVSLYVFLEAMNMKADSPDAVHCIYSEETE